MVTVIQDCGIFGLEVMGSTLILVRNLRAGGKVVRSLLFIQRKAQRNIGVIQIITLRKLDSGDTRHILGGVSCLGTCDNDIVAAASSFAVCNRGSTQVAVISIGVPFATGKGPVVAIFQVVDIVGVSRRHGTRRTCNRTAGARATSVASRIRLGKRGEHIGIHPLATCRIGRIVRTTRIIGRVFHLVGNRPVRTGKLVCFHPVVPGGAIG